MTAPADITATDIAKALGGDATLYVEREAHGALATWLAEVDFMGDVLRESAATLPEAVIAVLADLATERVRDPSHRLRDSVRGLLAVKDGRVTGEEAERIEAQARRLAAGG